MTILTTAKDGAIDSATLDIDKSTVYIRFFVEEDALVALTGTEDITRIRMCYDLSDGTWHTDGTAGHLDGSRALHIRSLTTAIDVRYDMSSGDIDRGVALDAACGAEIFADAFG